MTSLSPAELCTALQQWHATRSTLMESLSSYTAELVAQTAQRRAALEERRAKWGERRFRACLASDDIEGAKAELKALSSDELAAELDVRIDELWNKLVLGDNFPCVWNPEPTSPLVSSLLSATRCERLTKRVLREWEAKWGTAKLTPVDGGLKMIDVDGDVDVVDVVLHNLSVLPTPAPTLLEPMMAPLLAKSHELLSQVVREKQEAESVVERVCASNVAGLDDFIQQAATVLAASLLTAQLAQTRDSMRQYPSPEHTATPLAADEKGGRERRVGALLGGGGVVTTAVVDIWKLVEQNPHSAESILSLYACLFRQSLPRIALISAQVSLAIGDAEYLLVRVARSRRIDVSTHLALHALLEPLPSAAFDAFVNAQRRVVAELDAASLGSHVARLRRGVEQCQADSDSTLHTALVRRLAAAAAELAGARAVDDILATADIAADACEPLAEQLDALAQALPPLRDESRLPRRLRATAALLRLSLVDIRAQLDTIRADMGSDDDVIHMLTAVFEESPKRSKLLSALGSK